MYNSILSKLPLFFFTISMFNNCSNNKNEQSKIENKGFLYSKKFAGINQKVSLPNLKTDLDEIENKIKTIKKVSEKNKLEEFEEQYKDLEKVLGKCESMLNIIVPKCKEFFSTYNYFNTSSSKFKTNENFNRISNEKKKFEEQFLKIFNFIMFSIHNLLEQFSALKVPILKNRKKIIIFKREILKLCFVMIKRLDIVVSKISFEDHNTKYDNYENKISEYRLDIIKLKEKFDKKYK